MPKHDYAHVTTEKYLAALEKRISEAYDRAAKEMQSTVDSFFKKFEKRDAEKKKNLDSGKITEQEYKQWRLQNIARGKQMESMRDKLADRMTRANEISAAYINDATPGIYSLNRNYASYTIERVAGNVDFTLFDEQTVRRLLVEEPSLMPNYPAARAVDRGIDLAYGKSQIQKEITSGILQGKSIPQMARSLSESLFNGDKSGAIRAARTSVTGAQNAGRIDSYDAARKIGIDVKKEWLATLDSRTRHSHAMLDGIAIDNDEKFNNGCMFPGDPNGPPEEVYNCRCTLIAKIENVDTSDALRRDRRGVLPDMTFSQWENSKRGQGILAYGVKKRKKKK